MDKYQLVASEEAKVSPPNINCQSPKLNRKNMVYKVWNSKIFERIRNYEEYSIVHFHQCQWQKSESVSVAYVIYRILMALFTIAVMAFSIIEQNFEPEETTGSLWKWLIFLTHWGYVLIVVQCILGAFFVLWKYIGDQEDNFERSIPKLHRFYAIVHSMSVVIAFAITIMYWTLVYNPESHKLDATNFLLHAVNSVIMLLDIFLVRHSMQLFNVVWVILFSFSYAVFSYIYFLAGGKGKQNADSIYPLLNWSTPSRTVVIVIFSIVFCIFLYLLVYGLVAFRRYLAKPANKYTLNEKVDHFSKTIQENQIV